jgi:hypothetical protein
MSVGIGNNLNRRDVPAERSLRAIVRAGPLLPGAGNRHKSSRN